MILIIFKIEVYWPDEKDKRLESSLWNSWEKNNVGDEICTYAWANFHFITSAKNLG